MMIMELSKIVQIIGPFRRLNILISILFFSHLYRYVSDRYDLAITSSKKSRFKISRNYDRCMAYWYSVGLIYHIIITITSARLVPHPSISVYHEPAPDSD